MTALLLGDAFAVFVTGKRDSTLPRSMFLSPVTRCFRTVNPDSIRDPCSLASAARPRRRPDADRFHSDTVGEEHLRRKAQYEKTVQMNNNRRQVRRLLITGVHMPLHLPDRYAHITY